MLTTASLHLCSDGVKQPPSCSPTRGKRISGKARQPLEMKEGNIAFNSRVMVHGKGVFGIPHVCVVDKDTMLLKQ